MLSMRGKAITRPNAPTDGMSLKPNGALGGIPCHSRRERARARARVRTMETRGKEKPTEKDTNTRLKARAWVP